MEDPTQGFAGRRVVAFESRHTEAMERLIQNSGGKPFVAPSMREVPLSQNEAAFEFARELFAGHIDLVVFLTGVGTRILTRIIESKYTRAEWVDALSRVVVVARGPKPVAALSELGITPQLKAPEPNTWRELLAALDASSYELAGRRVAVQEYGVTNPELLEALASRGARVRRVPIYNWELPVDTGPLKQAVDTIAAGQCDVVLFTTSVQVIHLMKIAAEMGREADLRQAIARLVIGSIGPTTSEMLREYGIAADLEPTHPKMGFLVREAAERAADVLRTKREKGALG